MWQRFTQFTGWQYENSFSLLKTKQRILTLLSYPKLQEKWVTNSTCFSGCQHFSWVSILTNCCLKSARVLRYPGSLSATQYSSIFLLLFSLNRSFYGVKMVSICLKQKLLKSTFPFQLLSLKIKCKWHSNEFSFPLAFIIIIVNNKVTLKIPNRWL